MINAIKLYIKDYWTIMTQPILFYSVMVEENWQEKALTFCFITARTLAVVATIVVFIIQYIPIGSTLVSGVSGLRFLLVLPVLITLAFVFFMITLLIIGGAFTMLLMGAMYILGVVLHYVYTFLLGGKGSMNRMIQSLLYSNAAFMSMIFVMFLMILTKYVGLPFSLFRVGFNVTYFFTLLYLYGLWAIAGRKTYGISKWKAFLGAILPIIVMLIFGVIFDKMALSKLQPWIG
jgi:hypothetical protein